MTTVSLIRVVTRAIQVRTPAPIEVVSMEILYPGYRVSYSVRFRVFVNDGATNKVVTRAVGVRLTYRRIEFILLYGVRHRAVDVP